MRHIRYMQRIAGGTLAIDPEANYWLDLIKNMTYRPIWRWHYARIWDEQHAGKQKVSKHPKARKAIKYTSMVTAVVLVFVLVISLFGWPTLTPYIEPKSDLSLTTFDPQTLRLDSLLDFGAFLTVLGTENSTTYSGGNVSLVITLTRTDSSPQARDILLNLTSGTFVANQTTKRHISNVTYYIRDDAGLTINYVTSDNESFGLVVRMARGSAVIIGITIAFRAFPTGIRSNYVTIGATGTEYAIYIGGGQIGHGRF